MTAFITLEGATKAAELLALATVPPLGTWKKHNIKPAANKKWAPSMPIIKNKEIFEFLKAGVRTAIKTEPESKAAVTTNNH